MTSENCCAETATPCCKTDVDCAAICACLDKLAIGTDDTCQVIVQRFITNLCPTEMTPDVFLANCESCVRWMKTVIVPKTA